MIEDELKEIQVIAQRKYPGRSWAELTPDEQTAVYADYEGNTAIAGSLVASGSDMMQGAGKEVGPMNVYTQNPWESLAGGLMSGYGLGMQGKSSKQKAAGSGALADLQTRRDAMDRQNEIDDARRAEEERRRFYQMILGR